MTIGFLLIFVGIQLNVVEQFQLSPQATRFWNERIVDPASELVSEADPYAQARGWQQQPSPYQSPYFQASWSNPVTTQNQYGLSNPATAKTLMHPSWICWPIFFAGTVFFLHGLSMRQ
jgi:hypothetical protein